MVSRFGDGHDGVMAPHRYRSSPTLAQLVSEQQLRPPLLLDPTVVPGQVLMPPPLAGPPTVSHGVHPRVSQREVMSVLLEHMRPRARRPYHAPQHPKTGQP